jgi:hypothetical protein
VLDCLNGPRPVLPFALASKSWPFACQKVFGYALFMLDIVDLCNGKKRQIVVILFVLASINS